MIFAFGIIYEVITIIINKAIYLKKTAKLINLEIFKDLWKIRHIIESKTNKINMIIILLTNSFKLILLL